MMNESGVEENKCSKIFSNAGHLQLNQVGLP